MVTRRTAPSISNNEPEEKEQKHTLGQHLFNFPFDKVVLNVIDTPGHPISGGRDLGHASGRDGDVVRQRARALTFHARKLWAEAAKASLGRAIVVSHPDAEHAELRDVADASSRVLGDVVVPLTYPDTSGHGFTVKFHEVLNGEGPRAPSAYARSSKSALPRSTTRCWSYLETVRSRAEDPRQAPRRGNRQGQAGAAVHGRVSAEDARPQELCAISSGLPSRSLYGGRAAAKPGTEPIGPDLSIGSARPRSRRGVEGRQSTPIGRMSDLRCLRGHLKAEEGFLTCAPASTTRSAAC